ncbi:molybdopterin-binding protein [Undibacterium sp. RTI2.1]|uniref:competence/damage-inducible protein A n=1 Tax=unclassified Undibacterium TaxID=2630295 RepID=UPI002AB42C0F|nr:MULTISPECIES: molybdopterin-binding protein [unclassified Undibacterium]MDY7538328.1 molybdopterin-binding protein [Undibacterium sp. 5I1]MEB0031538.1 molybdopterin-binding protein [Undibacterium sp. RTI2.1]MEB0115048.1 molybdopterin-binding protein [Undibacterium sp. RTI2.2]MEB0229397.1 molybdopterin-binding protein [Undibacterium sp. 10I3]MEB0256007.1 molybdopterin-binding protein [Undibacterium sp. 5I1]
MAIGLIIIGDEILSGKRADKHLPKVIELLTARGLQLDWAEYIGDDRTRITSTLERSFAGNDIVFVTGGIGATPDDHTRQCAAAALHLPIVLHPEAKTLIEQRITDMLIEAGKPVDLNLPENLHRLKMGEFPQGAQIIPNPYNKIPGFAIQNHYFVPGFPVMAWPMLEWVLDSHYSHLFHQHARAEKSVLVFDAMESTLTPMMEALESQYPLIKVFSLPSVGNHQIRRHIELGVKGEPQQVEAAFDAMLKGLDGFQAEYVPA